MVPSGNTGEAVQQYYDYLWSQRLSEITVPQIFIDWWGPIWFGIFALAMFLTLMFFSMTFNSVHRGRNHLYGAVSFAGQLFERVGPPALFGIFVWTTVGLWGLYYIVSQIIRGQTY